MIDLHYWPTPNGDKILIMLEETGIPYHIIPVRLGSGEQFTPEFLAISPNNKMPAIVDHAPIDGGPALSVFESGAILQYLADKSGMFCPQEARARAEVMQWLFWQMAGLGPMAGQAGYFRNYATEQVPHAVLRYTNEVNRLYGVLNARLAGRDYVAGTFSIADMAIWPWIQPEWHGQTFEPFPHLAIWHQRIGVRDSVKRTAEIAAPIRAEQPPLTDEVRNILYGQRAR